MNKKNKLKHAKIKEKKKYTAKRFEIQNAMENAMLDAFDATKVFSIENEKELLKYKENEEKEDMKGKKNKKDKKVKRIKEDKVLKKEEKNNKKKGKKQKKKISVFRKILRIILLLILIAIIAVVAGVVAIFKTDKWAITKEQLLANNDSTLYDVDGNVIVSLTGDEINKRVSLSEMGKIPDAFVAIEDERFYEHKGIDLKRTLGAILSYALHKGDSSYGGSSITQQLVKITMKDDSRSGIQGIERKIREWSRAYQVEQMLEKDEILERYLNRIYLGSASNLEVKGVEAAANYYFNCSAKDLSICKCAFIAGINHAPSKYTPFDMTEENKDAMTDKIKKRTRVVLDKMYELGKITEEEYNTAVEENNNNIVFEKGNVSNGNNNLSYHAAAAINQIAKELSAKTELSYDEAREQLVGSGYKIYTTVKTDMQNKLEEVFENSTYQVNGSAYGDVDKTGQSAMVIVDPATGYVVAEVGGLGTDHNTLGLNRGTSKRQGGSAFKPLVTIAPALENNVITPATLFYDQATSFGGYNVKDDSSTYYDQVLNMRDILTHSLNVPEVKLLSIMGREKSAEFLGKIGVEVDINNVGLSMALGSVDVSPVEMAAGYAMLANGGEYITPTFYTKVVDQDGNVVIEAKQERTRVMSQENAYLETDMLKGPIRSGTAATYSGFLGSMAVAGKTGTSDNAIDRWFCGYTPYYAAACWYGNDNGYQNKVSFNGSNPAARLWFNAMKPITAEQEVKDFERPEGITTVSICKATGRRATEECKDTYTEIVNKENIPEYCDGHEMVKICKETNKIATEFCPDIEEKAFGTIDTEKNATWYPRLNDGSEKPTETCDVHTEAPKVDVPNVVGKSEADARKALEAAGFKVEKKLDSDAKKIKGYVLRQSDTKAAKGATITIVINEAGIEATKVSVTYYSNGGTSVAKAMVEKGKTATKPTDPTKDGYTFAGWYCDTALTKPYDFKTPVNTDIAVYAKWNKKQKEEPKPQNTTVPDTNTTNNEKTNTKGNATT